MEKAAAVTLILTVLLILLRGKCAGVEVYGAFLSGAKKGMEAAWQLLPALTGMLLMLSLIERLWADGASCTPPIAPDGNTEPAAGGRADAHPPPDDRVGQFGGAAGDFRAVRRGQPRWANRVGADGVKRDDFLHDERLSRRGGREKAAGRAGRVAAVLPDVRVGLRANLLKNQENRLQERGKSCIINRYAG